MQTEQDPKHDIVDNRIVNRKTGEPIPDDEPIFILRARDPFSTSAIEAYALDVPSSQVAEVKERLLAFEAFRRKITSEKVSATK